MSDTATPTEGRRAGRPRINHEQVPLRLPAGSLARINAVLRQQESRSDLLRAAVAAELRRREAEA